MVGSEVDLFHRCGQSSAVEAEWENAPFATLIPGVTSAKYDISVSSFTINDERLQQVQMVNYFSAGTQWATAAGNPKRHRPRQPLRQDRRRPEGHRAGPRRPSRTPEEVRLLPDQIQQYAGQDTATAAVATGKADAMLADSP